jgi:hypothetical protein
VSIAGFLATSPTLTMITPLKPLPGPRTKHRCVIAKASKSDDPSCRIETPNSRPAKRRRRQLAAIAERVSR